MKPQKFKRCSVEKLFTRGYSLPGGLESDGCVHKGYDPVSKFYKGEVARVVTWIIYYPEGLESHGGVHIGGSSVSNRGFLRWVSFLYTKLKLQVFSTCKYIYYYENPLMDKFWK